MTDFAFAEAAGENADVVAGALSDRLRRANGHNVGFVYATSPLAASFGRLVDGLRRQTGVENWVGTVGHGVCATGVEYFGRPAAVALTCRFAEGSYQLLPTLADAGKVAELAGKHPVAGFGIVHGDPRNPSVTEIVASLARHRTAFLVGGLSSANSAFPQVAGSGIVDGGVSGILIGGRLDVAVGLTQGCTPIGATHSITRCQGQILATLDNQRAFDVLCEDVGIAEGADPRPWLANVHAAFPVAGPVEAGYVVRNLMGIDQQKGLIGVAETMTVGDRVLFVRRDRESAEKDLGRMVTDLKSRAGSRPRAGLYYSCVARGPSLFDREAYEMQAIRRVFGDIPIVGFFGNGEISNDRVYGYTGVLTLFS
jgi:small ligand-binding sensory domain FIST